MQFDLSDEQQAFRDSVRRLLRETADPGAVAAGRTTMDAVAATLEPQLADMGIGAILVPQEQGGLGLDLLTLGVVAECLGEFAAPSLLVHTALAGWLVAEKGDDTMRERWLEALTNGGCRAAIAMPDALGVARDIEMRRDQAGPAMRYDHVERAMHAEVLIAASDTGLAIVDMADVSVEPAREPLDPSRPTYAVTFDRAAGRPLDGGATERLRDMLFVLAAADASGAGRRALEMAVEYAGTRVQFDRPIGSFQGLKHQLANMATDMLPSQFLWWYAAYAIDQHQSDAPRSAALAKAHVSDVAVKTARAAVEAHGGIGYTWEYPLHLLLKRAMHDRVMLGTPTDLRARVSEMTGQTGVAA